MASEYIPNEFWVNTCDQILASLFIFEFICRKMCLQKRKKLTFAHGHLDQTARENDSSPSLMHRPRCKSTVEIAIFCFIIHIVILSIYTMEYGEPLNIMHFSLSNLITSVNYILEFMLPGDDIFPSYQQQWGETTWYYTRCFIVLLLFKIKK